MSKRLCLGPLLTLVLTGSALASGAFPTLLTRVSAQPGPVTGTATPEGGVDGPMLTVTEVANIVETSAKAVEGESLAITVVDRAGRILAVWHRVAATDTENQLSLSLARTGAFFSNDQAPLTSRTVRFLSGIHFPPGVKNQPNAALYGIENTNRVDLQVAYNGGKDFPPPLNIDGTGPSLGITTGKKDVFDSVPKAVNPGGVPIFKHGHLAGGVGVAGVAPAAAEYAAAQGSFGGNPGFAPHFPYPGVIFVEGIALPAVETTRRPAGVGPGDFPGSGSYRTVPGPGGIAPDGWLVGPLPPGPPAGPALDTGDVTRIIQQSIKIANQTRALIRLPLGSRAKFAIAVGDVNGKILGLYRMPDSTVFSLDVSVAKARNVVYFSGPNRTASELNGLPLRTAVTNRTLSFGSQPLFPPGINGTNPGPFFELFQYDTAHPGTQGADASANPKNGVVFFPGSIPLYKGGKLVGGLGVSGDGVEQDDFVAYIGAKGYLPPERLRADHYKIRRTRMPFLKFPRNPTL